MSSRRQILLARVNWYLQSSLKHITELFTGYKSYNKGGRYRQVSLYYNGATWPSWRLKLPGTGLYAQQRNIKTLHNCDRNPAVTGAFFHKWPVMGKAFVCHDVIMIYYINSFRSPINTSYPAAWEHYVTLDWKYCWDYYGLINTQSSTCHMTSVNTLATEYITEHCNIR